MGICQDGDIIYFSGGVNSDYSHISAICGQYNIKSQKYENKYQKNCEAYDLKEQKIIEMGKMKKRRCAFISCIYNEHLYVFGGYCGDKKRSKKIEKYNNKKKRWDTISFKLLEGIDTGIFIRSNNPDEFFILGGNTLEGPTDRIMKYNLQHEQGELVKQKISCKRLLAKSFVDSEGDIFLLGGDQDHNITFEQGNIETLDFQKFNNDQCKEKLIIDSNIFRSFNSANFINYIISQNDYKEMIEKQQIMQKQIKNPSFYFFGSSENKLVIKMNLYKNKFKKLQLPKELILMSFMGVTKLDEIGNQFLLVGGITDDLKTISNSTQIYDSKKNIVETVDNMIQGRYTFSLIKKDQYIYVLGGRIYGFNEEAIIHGCERFNIPQRKWENIASLNQKRCSASAVVINNQLYIAGGYSGENERVGSIEIYNEFYNRWDMTGIELKVNLEASQLIHFQTDQCNKVIFLGGRSEQGDCSTCWSYDISHGFDVNICQNAGNMQKARCLHKVIKIKNTNKYIVFGGSNNQDDLIEIVSFNNQGNIQNDNSEKKVVKNFEKFIQNQIKLEEYNLHKYNIL